MMKRYAKQLFDFIRVHLRLSAVTNLFLGGSNELHE